MKIIPAFVRKIDNAIIRWEESVREKYYFSVRIVLEIFGPKMSLGIIRGLRAKEV